MTHFASDEDFPECDPEAGLDKVEAEKEALAKEEAEYAKADEDSPPADGESPSESKEESPVTSDEQPATDKPDEAGDSPAPQEEAAADLAFGKVFADLPNLETLSFESCDRLSEHILLQLPRNLRTVKFINCMPLDSDLLSLYLNSHGHSYVTFLRTHSQRHR